MGVRAGSTGAAASGVTHDASPCQRTTMPVVHRRQRVRHQPSADFVLPRARLTGKPVAPIGNTSVRNSRRAIKQSGGSADVSADNRRTPQGRNSV
jgi:hypothetical protein